MSITVIELITDALQEINVIDANEAPSAEQGVRALRRLNQMMADWKSDGIDLGYYRQTSMSAVVPIREEDELGVTMNLATTLAGGYGIDPLPDVKRQAADYYSTLAKGALKYFEADMTQLPTAEGGYYGFPYWQ